MTGAGRFAECGRHVAPNTDQTPGFTRPRKERGGHVDSNPPNSSIDIERRNDLDAASGLP